MTPHPVCMLFPNMEPDDYAELKIDISEHGVRVPALTFDGQIIDGRHRWRACAELGIDCPTKEWKPKGPDDSMVEFVVSLNLHRRPITQSQRATISVEMLPLLEEEAKGRQRQAGGKKTPLKSRKALGADLPQAQRAPRSRDVAAKATGASARSVQDAKALKKKDPEAFKEVQAGKTTLNAAKKRTKCPPRPPTIKDGLEKQATGAVLAALEQRERFTAIANAIQKQINDVEKLASESLGAFLSVQRIQTDLRNAKKAVMFAMPYANCPRCKSGCDACRKQGWITKDIYNALPPEFK